MRLMGDQRGDGGFRVTGVLVLLLSLLLLALVFLAAARRLGRKFREELGGMGLGGRGE